VSYYGKEYTYGVFPISFHSRKMLHGCILVKDPKFQLLFMRYPPDRPAQNIVTIGKGFIKFDAV